jgi:hypothetical protein
MTIHEDVLRFARTNLNKKVGRGQCFDLVDQALRAAGAASAADYGPVGRNADYEWGLGVMVGSVRPGDIVQFRNYRVDFETEAGTGYETRGAPNHSAIVASVGEGGVIEVFEQNVYGVQLVKRNTLYFVGREGVRISGSFRYFRPQPRGE